MNKRWSLLALALILPFANPLIAQTGAPPKLASIPSQIQAHPAFSDAPWSGQLDNIAQSASLDEIRLVLPALVTLTESPDAQVRGDALDVLRAIAGRTKPGLPENRRQMDTAAAETLVPYLSRLEPRLMDSAAPCRRMALLVFGTSTSVRPTPPGLIKAAVAVLENPQSTRPIPDTTTRIPNVVDPPLGAQMLWILLPAGADYYLDPVTRVTVGRDSPEVQQAMINFLRRPDQTLESLTESIRALSLSQVKNPAVEAALVPWLNSSDLAIRKLVLENIAGFTLSPNDFADARARVSSIANDANAPADLRQFASALLPCWLNDRQHQGVCPPR